MLNPVLCVVLNKDEATFCCLDFFVTFIRIFGADQNFYLGWLLKLENSLILTE